MSTEDTPKPDSGLFLPDYAPEFRPRWPGDDGGFNVAQMQAYAAAAVAKERERCAMAVVDYSLSYPFDENDRSLFDECAQYVRDGVLPSA